MVDLDERGILRNRFSDRFAVALDESPYRDVIDASFVISAIGYDRERYDDSLYDQYAIARPTEFCS
jgi:hypothetical protein